jgi:hypothetical protein
MRTRFVHSLVSLLCLLAACSSDDETDSKGAGGSGGADASVGGTGGSAASGGTSATGGIGGAEGGGAGGTSGTSGSGGASGSAGVSGSGGSSGAAGSSGSAGAAGGDSGVSCSLGEACCSGGTCQNGFNCLGETCSCIKALHGNTILRTNGTVLSSGTLIGEGTAATPLGNVTEIFEGHFHGCALKSDGTVWCWNAPGGANMYGELGTGSVGGGLPAYVAFQVLVAPVTDGGAGAPLTNVTHLNSGSSRCYLASTNCAIRNDGSLWCWGEIGNGGGGNFFNDGQTGHRAYATQILAAAGTPLTGVNAVSLGRRHACLLKSGEVWCWAANIGGPLGVGDQTARVYPTKVTLPGAAQQVGAGNDVTCARVSDSVYCWGSLGSGQVGIGDPAANSDGCIGLCKLTPAQVQTSSGPLTGVVNLDVAYLSSCAKLTDDSLSCWGLGAGNVATPLSLSGNPVQNVALHTSCGTNGVTTALVWLSEDNVLKSPLNPVAQNCN